MREAGVFAIKLLAGGAAALFLLPSPALADWSTRASEAGFEAGTRVDGRFAGLLLRCTGDGGLEVLLTHNGQRFDREREHTLVLSVDGVATLLSARAREGSAGDDFVYPGTLADLAPLLDALSRGRTLEVSAPSARYDLSLTGSSAAIRVLRESCPGP